jgi:hypothetical protein
MWDFLLRDWAGWLLVPVSFVLPLVFRRFLRDGKSLAVVWLLIFLHQVVSITNVYFFTTLGADADANRMHIYATEMAGGNYSRMLHGGSSYEIILAAAYWLCGSSKFLGQELTILAFILSCFYFLRLVDLFDFTRFSPLLLILFGGFPTAVLFGSVTLREAWEVLFFMLALYYGVSFQISSRYSQIFLSTLFAALLGTLHNGLVPFVPFLIFLLFISRISSQAAPEWYLLSRRRVFAIGLLFILIAGFVFMFRSIDKIASFAAASALMSGKGVDYLETYRMAGKSEVARTTYKVLLDTSSVGSLALTLIPAFTYYMWAPFPWQISNAMDLYAGCEGMLRFALIFFSFVEFLKSSGERRSLCKLMLILYFSMSFLWSLGTMNYGTSIRHHLVSYWIIVLLGGPRLIEFTKAFFRYRSGRRHPEGRRPPTEPCVRITYTALHVRYGFLRNLNQ